MMVSRFRWALRVGLMFFAGVVPVIMLLVLLLVILPLAAVIPDMLWFVAAIGFLGVIGVVGP